MTYMVIKVYSPTTWYRNIKFADGNGITFGKATTNTAALKGKNNSSVGYIRFGSDGNSLGYNGTYLNYNNVTFRSGRIGIGEYKCSAPLEIIERWKFCYCILMGLEMLEQVTVDLHAGADGSSCFMHKLRDIANDVGWAVRC